MESVDQQGRKTPVTLKGLIPKAPEIAIETPDFHGVLVDQGGDTDRIVIGDAVPNRDVVVSGVSPHRLDEVGP